MYPGVGYSQNFLEKKIHILYNTLGVQLTDTLQVFDGCDRSEAKARYVRKKSYTRA